MEIKRQYRVRITHHLAVQCYIISIVHTFLIIVNNENTELHTLGKGEQEGKV